MLSNKLRKKRLIESISSKTLDAILVTSPENVFYITGFTPHQLTVSRQPGFAYAIVFPDENHRDFLITMDYEVPTFKNKSDEVEVLSFDTWVGVKSYDEFVNKKDEPKINKFRTSMDIVEDLINEYNLSSSVVGLEMQSLPVSHMHILTERFPNIRWIDVSDDFLIARSIKMNDEIEIYRRLTEACDKALHEMSKYVEVGAEIMNLIKIYRTSCLKNGFTPSSWSMLGSGPNSSMLKLPSNHVIKDGESLRFDGGCEADFKFYKTDFSRSWLVGRPDKKLVEIKKILLDAQSHMIEKIKPGLQFNELFELGFSKVKKKIPNYSRGHLGHSISLGPQTADKPYIALIETRQIEPGMILCIEVPFYIRDYNGFNIEDMILVTENGAEVLTYRTPHILPMEEFL